MGVIRKLGFALVAALALAAPAKADIVYQGDGLVLRFGNATPAWGWNDTIPTVRPPQYADHRERRPPVVRDRFGRPIGSIVRGPEGDRIIVDRFGNPIGTIERRGDRNPGWDRGWDRRWDRRAPWDNPWTAREPRPRW